MSEVLSRPEVDINATLAEIFRALAADELVPYLGPGLLALTGSSLPSAPEDVAAQLHKRAPAPVRVRTNMWSVAQFIEGRRHRKTLQAYMADIFSTPVAPSALHAQLAALKPSLIVNTWYDGAMAAALTAAGRDFAEVQGASRAIGFTNLWTRAYDTAGAEIPVETAARAKTVLYSPHGGARPANNFLVSDSDYVEVMTEIDIQTPIPELVQSLRTTRGFLFLGCGFHDQMLRTYARQIMKRSKGPHYAVIDVATATRNELRFLADQEVTIVSAALPAVEAACSAR